MLSPVFGSTTSAACTRCGHRFDEHVGAGHGFHPCDQRSSPSITYPVGKPCGCYAFEEEPAARVRLAERIDAGTCALVFASQYAERCLTHGVPYDFEHYLSLHPNASTD